jgi:hypothetical protein
LSFRRSVEATTHLGDDYVERRKRPPSAHIPRFRIMTDENRQRPLLWINVPPGWRVRNLAELNRPAIFPPSVPHLFESAHVRMRNPYVELDVWATDLDGDAGLAVSAPKLR